jgi:3',5'-cyclic AMP phosphodiesterase CpdA
MVVSWVTASRVDRPLVRFGPAPGALDALVAAETRTHVDDATGVEVFTHHATLRGLEPGSGYAYRAEHDGAEPVGASFATAPVGRMPFRFTSFGDQGTGEDGGPGSTSTIYGARVVGHVERAQPLFHLLNGDLAYANLAADRVGTWDAFFRNNSRSARFRPWMPALGNHENESGNGEQGFDAYRTRFALPANGSREFAGYWYAFRVGSVAFVSLDADDVVYQDGGSFYVRGYSGGAQVKWLESTLAAARADRDVDWIVVFMHQLAMSSALVNGPDLGVREEFLPVFDRHGVDLVLCGHDHTYERTHACRGVDASSPSLKPAVRGEQLDSVDTTAGAVHLCLGGGGSIDLHHTMVIGRTGHPVVGVIAGPEATDRIPEVCDWSAVRDQDWGYGFASIDVDPGVEPGGVTRLAITYSRTPDDPAAAPAVFDRLVLERRRSDG